jgi:uncharacterized membrane protein
MRFDFWHGSDDQPLHGKPLATRFRRILIAGLLILTPVALAAFVLVKLFQFLDGIFAPIIRRAVGLQIPGLGLVLTLLVVLMLGWLSTNVVGRRLLHAIEGLICRIPVARSVYSATKGVLQVLSHDQREAFKRVVLVEYPKADSFVVAFVTGGAQWPSLGERTSDLVMVFVPTTPNPTSGFLLLVPRENTIELPFSVEAGIRLVISGGLLLPPLAPAPAALKLASADDLEAASAVPAATPAATDD